MISHRRMLRWQRRWAMWPATAMAGVAVLVATPTPAHAAEVCTDEVLEIQALDMAGKSSLGTAIAHVRVCKDGTRVTNVTRTSPTTVAPNSSLVVDWAFANNQDGTPAQNPDGSWDLNFGVKLTVGLIGAKVSASGEHVGAEIPLSTTCIVQFSRHWELNVTVNHDKNFCAPVASHLGFARASVFGVVGTSIFVAKHYWTVIFPTTPPKSTIKIYACADDDLPCHRGESPPTVCIDGCATFEIDRSLNLFSNPYGTTWTNNFRADALMWPRDGIYGSDPGDDGGGGGEPCRLRCPILT